MDSVLPYTCFEIYKCAPMTYAEAKTMALNLEIAVRERSHQQFPLSVSLLLLKCNL